MRQLPTFVDIAILGGGPAGVATAIKLKQQNPALSVVLIERSNYDQHRIGESLPPGTKLLLDELKAWDAFEELKAKPVYGIESSWGNQTVENNDFLKHTAGHGWVVDRTAFDLRLAKLAEEHGVQLLLNARPNRISRLSDQRWEVDIPLSSKSLTVNAGFIVDATGRSASFARSQGAHPILFDRLVGLHSIFEGPEPAPTLIEAFKQGWWYSTSLPDGKRLVVCFTDNDFAHSLRNDWKRALQNSQQTKLTTQAGRLAAPIRTAPAHSQRLDILSGDNWLAVGDAASTFDPLSSQGIFKGLRSGIFAAYALADRSDLTRQIDKYQRFVNEEFEGYLDTRVEFYATEQRWLNESFWQRRRNLIHLDPQSLLTSATNREVKRFYHLSRLQTAQALAHCNGSTPAHQVVSSLQTQHSSLSTNQIILGLQHLVQSGVLFLQTKAITC